MKRVTVLYRSAKSIKREADAKKLSTFLDTLRAKGQSDEQTAIDLGTSRDTIYAWRNKVRFPRALTIHGIEAKYGVKII